MAYKQAPPLLSAFVHHARGGAVLARISLVDSGAPAKG